MTVNASPVANGSVQVTPASRAIVTTSSVPTTAGSARRASVASARAACRAVTMPPVQARNVPSIHQIGRYHHVLPPPIASHVQGYAFSGRNTTMSIAMNTIVPTSPVAAAPAIPSPWRAADHWAGRKLAATPAARTMSASTPLRRPPVAGTRREAARNSTTASAVMTPILAPPTVTVRKSERSVPAGAAVADMLSPLPGWMSRSAKSKPVASAGKHQQDREIGHRPRAERPVHAALVIGRGPAGLPRVPRPEHDEPGRERHHQQHGGGAGAEPPPGPAEQGERDERAGDRYRETRPHPEDESEGAVAATAVLLELIQLGERIEPREERAESEQHQRVPGVERPAGRRPGRERGKRPEAPHVDEPVHAGHGLEAERRHRVEQRQREAEGVIEAERGRQREREELAPREQRHAEREQVARQRRWRDQVSDVALVLVEHGVDGQRPTVEKNHPHREAEQRWREPLPSPHSPETDRQHVAEQGVPRHDRPFGGAHVQDVGEQLARQHAVAHAAPGVARAGVRYHFSPSAVAANRSPVSVRSGCTDSISRTSGATRPASPPVAITWGVCLLGHSALMRRTTPSTASAVPSSTPARIASSVRRPIVCAGGVSSVAGSFAVPRISASEAVRIPGMITPPRKRPSAVMQSNVVAVPKSTTMVSRWKSCAAARVLRMRSAPTWSGSSTSSSIGSAERPSTTTGRTVVARSTASHSPCVTGGTTEAMTAARTSWVERPAWAR